MKVNSEAKLSQWLREGLSPHCNIERIECKSGGGLGIPDIHISTDDVLDIWLELKYTKELRNMKGKGEDYLSEAVLGLLRPSQIAWAQKRSLLGKCACCWGLDNCFVLVSDSVEWSLFTWDGFNRSEKNKSPRNGRLGLNEASWGYLEKDSSFSDIMATFMDNC